MSSTFDPSKIKAIIFDLDDTLYLQADYKRSGFRAVAKWLEEHEGLDANESYQDLEQLMETKGPSYPRLFDDFVSGQQLNPTLSHALTQVFIDHQPELACFAGVDNLLSELRTDYRLGILTDGRKSSQEKKVTALKLRSKVDAILFSDSLTLCKPAEELFGWFEEQFQLYGQELAYVGDNPRKDFIGAKKRNWLTIRVLTGEYRRLQVAQNHDASITISSLMNLKSVLS